MLIWWFSSDVIRNNDYANYDQFLPNFVMTCNIIYVSIPNLKSFGPLKAELVSGPRSWKISFYVMWENGLVGMFMPTNMAAAIYIHRYFITLNSFNSSIY